MKVKTPEDLKEVKEKGINSHFTQKPRFRFGVASCGLGAGAKATMEAMEEVREGEKIGRHSIVGCIGACYAEPLVELYIPRQAKILFKNVGSEKGQEIMEAAAEGHILEGYVFCKIEDEYSLITEERKSLRDLPPSGDIQAHFDRDYLEDVLENIPEIEELDFFKKQRKVVLRNTGYINPERIEEYIARGGYTSLHKALQMDRDSIIEEVTKSKLRGRGGAGFPTGKKWKLAKDEEDETKYIISNGDEGDPGAYMDRVVLESDPHSMLEGMIIGAYTIGANKGFVFVRNEYPKAVERLQIAIEQAEDYGLLGKDIMKSGFDFELEISRGGGAFVCGEETALMSAIEGNFPAPRPRPPYPTESGLWGKPTVINNVKTWANIPVIISRGEEFLAEMGTENSGGTKVFSLVGDVERRGLIEVSLGTLLREIVIDIGNADPDEVKAVQTGGPSGGFIPVEYFDTPLDYETLSELGSIMGSGGLMVADENACMVDMARYFLDFTLDESCGQCTPCREGLDRMLEILNRITSGKGEEKDLDLLRELADYVGDASLCALGGTAPNPVLSTMDNFEEEYEEHVKEKKCRAGVCDMSSGGEDE